MKTKLTPEIREKVILRDAHICRYCFAGWNLEIHHRQGRGGGDPNRLSNLLTLCRPCHQRCTENPEMAYALGLSVKRIGLDQPDEIPFQDVYGQRWGLTDEGDLFRLPIGGRAA